MVAGTVALIAISLLPAQADPKTATELSIPIFGSHGDETKQLQVTSTDSVRFAPGGLIRITGSYGDLAVEGWDQPEVQVEVKKSLSYGFKKEDPQRFERVKVSIERHSDSELSIVTNAPSPNRLVHPFGGKGGGVAVEYRIRVPRNSRLMIQHGVGMISMSDVIGDVDASASRGDILMWLPGAGSYDIDAKSKFGLVASDFAGSPRLVFYRLGERFASEQAPASPHIHLRMGFGGITIKRLPPESEPGSPAPAK